MRPTRVLLVGLSPMAEDVLVRYIAGETGLELAGRIGAGIPLMTSPAVTGADVLLVGADHPLGAGERTGLLERHPDLLVLTMAPDERSTCVCSTASPQDVLRCVRGGAGRPLPVARPGVRHAD